LAKVQVLRKVLRRIFIEVQGEMREGKDFQGQQ
jgi:hypothetical protein